MQELFCSFSQGVLRVGVRKTKLPKREVEICSRLREAREELELTQAACARQIGLERTTLLNYEHCRTPVRFEVALRFCRQFIVSEEWLATGRFDAVYEKARQQGGKPGFGRDSLSRELNRKIFFRQCVDLLSEPVTLHIPTGILFSEAYDKVLAAAYRDLVSKFYPNFRICLTDADKSELAVNLLNAINDRFICLLSSEALRRGNKESDAWRVYTREVFTSSYLIFKKMMRYKLAPDELDSVAWLRNALSDASAGIPFIGETPETQRPKSPQLALVS